MSRARSGVEAPRRDELAGVGREERIGLQRARAFEALLGGVGGDVEQQRGNAGVGEVRGDLRAHDAGAQDRDGAGSSRSVYDINTLLNSGPYNERLISRWR